MLSLPMRFNISRANRFPRPSGGVEGIRTPDTHNAIGRVIPVVGVSIDTVVGSSI